MRSLSLLVLLVAAGCESATAPSIAEGVRLAAPGAAVPTLAARGDPQPTGGAIVFASFAAARDTAGTLAVFGMQEVGTKGDLFVLQTIGNQAGTYTGCGQDLSPSCHGRYIVGVSQGDVAAHDAWYEIVGGEVEIERVGGGRVAGRFDVVLRPREGGSPVTATGEFNVPVIGSATAAAVSCFDQRVAGGAC